MPFKVRLHWIFSNSKIEDKMAKRFIKYHISDKLNQNRTKKISKISKMYLNYYINFFKKNKIDCLITSGDTRLFVESLVYIAKSKKIKIYYFEQGPHKTTIIDRNGVNANSSFRSRKQLNPYPIKNFKDHIDFLNKEKRYKKNLIYKMLKFFDYILQFSILGDFFYKELFIKYLDRRKEKVNRTKITKSRYNILLILQVPFDAQIYYHSPLVKNFFEWIKITKSFLPKKYNLIIKEHPLYKGKYSEELYSFVEKNSNIFILEDIDMSDALELSDFVIINNSLAGIESIIANKKTIVLGNSFYDREGVVKKINSWKEYDEVLNNLDNVELKKKDLEIFISTLFFDYLFSGHFMNRDLKFTKDIAEFILEDYYENY